MLSIIFLILKKLKFVLISFASALFLLGSISVFENKTFDSIETQNNISVSHFNVLRTNKNYDTIINSALKTESDIISFQEISSDWKDTLINSLSEKYPFYIIKEKDDNYFGIALFSKYKLEKSKIINIEGIPNIFASIEKVNTLINIITIHTNSPIDKTRFIKRNKHIKCLSNYLKKNKTPLLVIGDFNAVPWDSRIIDLKKESNLIDSRNTFSSTWPRQMGNLGIPLDYIFHTIDFTCTNFQVIRVSSSDHCGIKGNYNLKINKLAASIGEKNIPIEIKR
jgi:endonuclease/exonuclease/phosphatase (EEP) superfamily protein YafD